MKNVLLLFCVALSTMVSGQSSSLESTIDTYFKATENWDSEAIMNLMHPKMYEVITKEEFEEAMAGVRDSEAFSVDMKEYELKDISKAVTFEGANYHKVDYDFIMTMTFKDPNYFVMSMTKSMLESQYGNKNVKETKENESVEVKAKGSMFAISEPAFEGWRFLEDEEGSPFLESIIPDEVREKLK